MIPKPIHPFPARMAPDVALAQCEALSFGAITLDPMAGSGTVLRVAAERGLHAVGFDSDPLAVLMSRVWTTPVDPDDIRLTSRRVVEEAENLNPAEITLPWIDGDLPTSSFVDFWFAPRQQYDLRRLSSVLDSKTGPAADALRVALSRIIITKDRGASLGRDISHSRPHRAYTDNKFHVLEEFVRSSDGIARRVETQPPPGNVEVQQGDARILPLLDSSVDAVITSPPYLNAIDYIRGHRLSLVWLGYRVEYLRELRARSIGAERKPDRGADIAAIANLIGSLGDIGRLPENTQGMVTRYLLDITKMMREIRRVLKPGGRVVLVVGNSHVRNVFIDNAAAINTAAQMEGLESIARIEREIPASRRYLPPPASLSASDLRKRMRTEVVLTFSG